MKSKKLTKKIVNEIIKKLLDMNCDTDLSDIGNEIGIVVGENILHVDKIGFSVDCFIDGIKHGISLTDGTH